jgi:protein TonB
MFDSVLSKTEVPQGNVAGIGLSLAVCGTVITSILCFPASSPTTVQHEVDVRFAAAPPPPPPPPPAASGSPTPSEQQPLHKSTPKIKREIPVEHVVETVHEPDPEPTPPDPTPAKDPGVVGGVQGGVVGGVVGGVIGGVQGGKPGGTIGGVLGGTGTAAVPFGLGMTRPQQIAGSQPEYTREAIAARVEGKVLVRCVITVQGAITDCKVIKGVPMLQEISLEALRRSRFTPVMYQGHPETVQYLFTFNFKLP